MGKYMIIELEDLLEPTEMDVRIQNMLENNKESCTLFRYENEKNEIIYGRRSDLCTCVRSGQESIPKESYLPIVLVRSREDTYHTLKNHS